MKTKRLTYEVPDYKHNGDLSWAQQELKSNFPFVTIVKAYEERDSEAEWDYKDEYGEDDFEPIYKGYIIIDVPEDKVKLVEDYCY